LSGGGGRDRFEGRCHLDWWANSVTCLASIAVSVIITVGETGWAAGGGESLDQVTTRAHAALRELARDNRGRLVLVASHGTFITRALYGFGSPVGSAFWHRMPMPAVYRLRFADPAADPVVTCLDKE
jgi:broad specificity phosphatase PhoE